MTEGDQEWEQQMAELDDTRAELQIAHTQLAWQTRINAMSDEEKRALASALGAGATVAAEALRQLGDRVVAAMRPIGAWARELSTNVEPPQDPGTSPLAKALEAKAKRTTGPPRDPHRRPPRHHHY